MMKIIVQKTIDATPKQFLIDNQTQSKTDIVVSYAYPLNIKYVHLYGLLDDVIGEKFFLQIESIKKPKIHEFKNSEELRL